MIRGGFNGVMDEISDHRALWMEVTMDLVLGIDRGVFQRPITRKLQIRNMKVTSKFNQALESQIDQHGLITKAERLLNIARKMKKLTQTQKQQCEALDTQRRRAVGYANKRCSKLPSDNADFSPTLQTAIGLATIHLEIERRIRTKRRVHT